MPVAKRAARLVCGLTTAGLIAMSMVAAGSEAVAQAPYPDRTVKIIVGFPAGTPPDVVARLLADKLQSSLGKPLVVENVVGAGGNAASSRFAKSEPDGYTLYLAGNGAMVINPSLYEKLPFDPQKDMVPVSLIASWPNVLAVSNDVPAKTVQDLVALAREKPDELTYAHAGIGTSTHLAPEQLKQMGRLAIRPVAYTGGNQIMADIVGGRISLCFCGITSVLALSKDAKVRALAVTSLERSPAAPDLPTVAESGFPGFHATAWFGLMAPAGTSQTIIEKLSGEAAKAIKAPDVVATLGEQGIQSIGSTPSEMADVMSADTAYWAKLINAIGLKLK